MHRNYDILEKISIALLFLTCISLALYATITDESETPWFLYIPFILFIIIVLITWISQKYLSFKYSRDHIGLIVMKALGIGLLIISVISLLLFL